MPSIPVGFLSSRERATIEAGGAQIQQYIRSHSYAYSRHRLHEESHLKPRPTFQRSSKFENGPGGRILSLQVRLHDLQLLLVKRHYVADVLGEVSIAWAKAQGLSWKSLRGWEKTCISNVQRSKIGRDDIGKC